MITINADLLNILLREKNIAFGAYEVSRAICSGILYYYNELLQDTYTLDAESLCGLADQFIVFGGYGLVQYVKETYQKEEPILKTSKEAFEFLESQCEVCIKLENNKYLVLRD